MKYSVSATFFRCRIFDSKMAVRRIRYRIFRTNTEYFAENGGPLNNSKYWGATNHPHFILNRTAHNLTKMDYVPQLHREFIYRVYQIEVFLEGLSATRCSNTVNTNTLQTDP